MAARMKHDLKRQVFISQPTEPLAHYLDGRLLEELRDPLSFAGPQDRANLARVINTGTSPPLEILQFRRDEPGQVSLLRSAQP